MKLHATDDAVLARYVASVAQDPDTFGLLLHGSRASGRHREDSDYDLIRIVTPEAYDARHEADSLLEKITLEDGFKADVLYQTLERIETYVTTLGWYTAPTSGRSSSTSAWKAMTITRPTGYRGLVAMAWACLMLGRP